MIFLGVDLGWTTGATGLAAIRFVQDHLTLSAVSLAHSHEQTLEWIAGQAGDSPAMIAIDAPTVIRNPTGQRPGERALNAVFRKHLLNCHPANLGRPFAHKTTAFANTLEAQGYRHAPGIQARSPGRYQIEVFPHAAIVRLFQFEQRLRYKKGSAAERSALLAVLRERIASLRGAEPPLITPALPVVEGVKGRARKDAEDQLDAILCAYIGAHYWWWGAERNDVFGDAESGYLVVPRPR